MWGRGRWAEGKGERSGGEEWGKGKRRENGVKEEEGKCGGKKELKNRYNR